MYLLISLFWLLTFSGFLTIISEKRVEKMIPISFIISIFILYIFSFFKILHIGFYVILEICILFCLFFIFCFFKRTEIIKEFLNNYLTIGLFVYLILFVGINYFYRNMSFTHWDEFMHWGPMVKEMIKYDTFYSVPEAFLMMHKDYPPFYPLLGCLFSFFRNTNYAENRLYIAHFSFVFSLFMPLFSKLDRKKIGDYLNGLLMFIGVLLIGLLVHYTPDASDNALFYNSIYVDWSLSALVAYTFYIIITETSNIRYFNIFLCFISLVSTKQVGLPFFLLGLMLFIIKEFFIDKNKINYKQIIISLLPFIMYFAWKYYINLVGALSSAQFDSNQIDFKLFFSIAFNGGGETWQQLAFNNYINALFKRYLLITPIKLNYFFSAQLITVLLVLLGIVYKEIKNTISVSIVYFFGSIAYAFLMLLLYCFSFGENEGPIIASFNRYMIAYLFIGLCILFMLAYEYGQKDSKSKIVKILVTTILIASLSDINGLKNFENKRSNEFYNDPLFSSLENAIEGKKVLIVEQYTSQQILGYIEPYLLDYYGYFDNGTRLVRLGKRNWDTPLTIEPTLSEWIELVKEYDYLCIMFADEHFLNNYWEVFNADLLNRALYKINVSGNQVSLELENVFYSD